MRILIGVLLAVVCYVLTISLTGISLFFDFPSICIICVPMLCYFPLSGSGRIILDYIKKSFQKTPKYSEGELENISAALANAIKMVLGLAAYGFFYGLIAALYNLSDISRLGPIVAISLLSSFYSITLCVFVFFPTKVWADLKLKEKTKGGGIKRGGEDNESETF